jgi:glycosyltransferase involved in cell wall biosynthesis
VTLQPIPNEDLRRLDECTWEPCGLHPSFELCPLSGTLPSHWCFLHLEIQPVDRDAREHPSLAVSSGPNDTEVENIRCAPSVDGVVHMLVQLPAVVRKMRLDVTVELGRFQLGAIRITEIGKARAAIELLRSQVAARPSGLNGVAEVARETIEAWRGGGLGAVRKALRRRPRLPPGEAYSEWVQAFDTIRATDRFRILEEIARMPDHPVVSLSMIVQDTPEELLRDSLESVSKQLYPRWELCVVDNGSSLPHVRRTLGEYSTRDTRIRVVRREESGARFEALNSALEMARGGHAAFLEDGDVLAEHALYVLVDELVANPGSDLSYSDDDRLDLQGQRSNPRFKPDWNPELLWSGNYVGGLAAYRTELLRAIGGFRSGVEGAEAYDLCLRVGARTKADKIRHIPRILLHSSLSPQQIADEAGIRAVSDHLRERGLHGTVTRESNGPNYRVRLSLPERRPLVSLLIPTRDGLDMIRRCVTSIRRLTMYEPYEIVVVDTGSRDPATLAYLESQLLRRQQLGCFDDVG